MSSSDRSQKRDRRNASSARKRKDRDRDGNRRDRRKTATDSGALSTQERARDCIGNNDSSPPVVANGSGGNPGVDEEDFELIFLPTTGGTHDAAPLGASTKLAKTLHDENQNKKVKKDRKEQKRQKEKEDHKDRKDRKKRRAESAEDPQKTAEDEQLSVPSFEVPKPSIVESCAAKENHGNDTAKRQRRADDSRKSGQENSHIRRKSRSDPRGTGREDQKRLPGRSQPRLRSRNRAHSDSDASLERAQRRATAKEASQAKDEARARKKDLSLADSDARRSPSEVDELASSSKARSAPSPRAEMLKQDHETADCNETLRAHKADSKLNDAGRDALFEYDPSDVSHGIRIKVRWGPTPSPSRDVPRTSAREEPRVSARLFEKKLHEMAPALLAKDSGERERARPRRRRRHSSSSSESGHSVRAKENCSSALNPNGTRKFSADVLRSPSVERPGLQPLLKTLNTDGQSLGFDDAGNSRERVSIPVPEAIVAALMTPQHQQLLIDLTGAVVSWCPKEFVVEVVGSAEQVQHVQRLLGRVTTHCQWGCGQDKICRILKPRKIESVMCRLSPMNKLPAAEKKLNAAGPALLIGKDRQNDVVVGDALISRVHCGLELDIERGGVYVIDHSTNGTFLNGLRLPPSKHGKVFLSHGDELLLKDPATGETDFGYILSLAEVTCRRELEVEAALAVGSDNAWPIGIPQGKKGVILDRRAEAPPTAENRSSAPMCLTGARLERLSGGGFRGDGMCGDFQKGKCSRGQACRYAHVKTRVEGSAPLLVDHLVLRVAAQITEGRIK